MISLTFTAAKNRLQLFNRKRQNLVQLLSKIVSSVSAVIIIGSDCVIGNVQPAADLILTKNNSQGNDREREIIAKKLTPLF